MPVGWLPRGGMPDPHSWAYDLTAGKWVGPDDAVRDDHQIVEMPPDFDPRTRGQGVQVVLSPPGTAAPPGALSYTPITKGLHGPGEVPPMDLENLSVILAPRPGPPAPPVAPPIQPMGGPPMPVPPPDAQGVESPPVAGQPPPLPVSTPPPGPPPPQVAPRALPGQMPVAPPQAPMTPPGEGRPPSLYSTKAHAFLNSLLGMTQAAPPVPGAGQDVGAGEDVGVGAALPPTGLPADINQNTLPGLTPSQAAAFCGPAGVLDLMQQYEGRNIPIEAVVQKAQERDPRTGRPYWQGQMNGPQEFANLLDEFGYEPTMISLEGGRQAEGWRQVESALRRGQRVVVDTPGHYYQLEEMDAAGNIRMGDVVGQARGGTIRGPQDITNMGYGAPRTAITATPRAGGPAEARQIGNVRLLSAQDGGGPRLGPNGVEGAPGAPLVGVTRDQFAANAMLHANAAARIIRDNYGVEIPPEVLAGYAAHETGYGTNNLARNYGNFMSIYAPNPWTGASRTFTGDRPVRTVQAATYNSPTESFVHFGQQMANNPRYRAALDQYKQDHDTARFLQNVNRAGWAEDQNWWSGVLNSAQTVMSTAAQAGVHPGDSSEPAPQEPGSSILPDWLRNGITGLVDRALGVSTAYADQGPLPSTPDGAVTGTRVPLPTAPQPQSDGGYNIGTFFGNAANQARGIADAAGSAAQWYAGQLGGQSSFTGPSVRNFTPPWANRSPQLPPSQPAPVTRPDMQDFSPQLGRQTPEAPADPRLSAVDEYGRRIWGPAGSMVPFPGMPWMPWGVYGPDEGDGMGKLIDDPRMIETVRKAAQDEYEIRLRRQLQDADNDAKREVARLQLQQAQTQWRENQDRLIENARERRENAREARALQTQRLGVEVGLQQQRITAQETQFWNTLHGPEGFKVAQALAPGGMIVDRVGQVMYGLDTEGNILNTWRIPGEAPKGEHIPGRGYMQASINPQTRDIEMKPIAGVPGAQQIVNGTVVQESPGGYQAVSRLAEDPQVTRWTDPWGREFAMNARTGERILFNEGSPKIEQRGRVTYSVPPPETPRYIAPWAQPTTYGRPEIPWAHEQRLQLPPGSYFREDGSLVIPVPQQQQSTLASTTRYAPPQQPQPQFVQPQIEEQPEEAALEEDYGY